MELLQDAYLIGYADNIEAITVARDVVEKVRPNREM